MASYDFYSFTNSQAKLSISFLSYSSISNQSKIFTSSSLNSSLNFQNSSETNSWSFHFSPLITKKRSKFSSFSYFQIRNSKFSNPENSSSSFSKNTLLLGIISSSSIISIKFSWSNKILRSVGINSLSNHYQNVSLITFTFSFVLIKQICLSSYQMITQLSFKLFPLILKEF